MGKHKKNKNRVVEVSTTEPANDTSGGRFMVSLPIGIGKMNNGPPATFQQETVHFSLEADNIEDARLKFTDALLDMLAAGKTATTR